MSPQVSPETLSELKLDLERSNSSSQYIDRAKNAGELFPFERFVRSIAPARANDIHIYFNPENRDLYPTLKSDISLYLRAQEVVQSIQELGGRDVLPMLSQAIDWVDFDEIHPQDTSVAREIKTAVGLYALHKSLEIVRSTRSTDGEQELPGKVQEFLANYVQASEVIRQVDDLAEAMPILDTAASEFVTPIEWYDQEESFTLMKSIEADPENYLQILGNFDRIHKILKEAARNRQMWEREGLSTDTIPTVSLELQTLLRIARFTGWSFLKKDVESEEMSIADEKLYMQDWEQKKRQILDIGLGELEYVQYQSLINELDTIESGLF
jgi:hypothetical protein